MTFPLFFCSHWFVRAMEEEKDEALDLFMTPSLVAEWIV
jgi:hypothetical protein